MKLVEVKSSTSIDCSKETNDKDTKFKIGNNLRISRYKSLLAKGFNTIWLEDVLTIKKVKNTVPWTYVINGLNREEIVGTFYGK